MNLYLVDGGLDARIPHQRVDVRPFEAADADCLDFSCIHKLLHNLPRLFHDSFAPYGEVDEHQVDVAAQLGDALFQRLTHPTRVHVLGRYLRGDEHFLTFQSALADAFVNLRLVAVGLRGVNMTVAKLQRVLHRPDRRVARQGVSAEAEHRHLHSACQCDGRNFLCRACTGKQDTHAGDTCRFPHPFKHSVAHSSFDYLSLFIPFSGCCKVRHSPVCFL